MTTIHVTAIPMSDLGLVMLRVDTSGAPPPAGTVILARRNVGATSSMYPTVPAGFLSTEATVQLVGTSAAFVDSTAPLDTPVEYLAGLPGATLSVVASPVTVASGGRWWLGDPLRPYLDMSLVTKRSSGLACPIVGYRVISSLGDDAWDGRRDLVDVPGSRYPIAAAEPMASPTFEIRFGTRTLADRQAAEALFAPGDTLLLRAPTGYGLDPTYVAVTSLQLARVSANHQRTERVVTARVKVMEQPAGAAYGWLGARWADLCSGAYPTWSAMTAAGLSWGSLGTGVASGAYPTAMRTWSEVSATWATWALLTATGKTWEAVAVGS